MHADDEFEIRHVHLGEGFVSEYARVVDENVDPAPFLLRPPSERRGLLEIGHIGGIGYRGAAGRANLLHDLERIVGRTAVSADVVDDDFGATGGKA